MPIEWIEEIEISDGKSGRRTVRKGDLVNLLPEEQGGSPRSEEFIRWFFGGEGPYTIARIGVWPCGRGMLYIKKDGGEPGAHASDFMYAGQE